MTYSIRATLLTGAAILGFGALLAPTVRAQPVQAATTAAEAPATEGAQRAALTHVDQRIGELHAKLAITPEQQPQWDRFTKVMRDNAVAMDQRFQRRRQTLPTMSAVENMQSYAHLVVEHGQDVQKLSTAFNALYASLSASQRRTADQSFRDDGHRGDPTRSSR
jgi:hypothetical protein